jgi:hypothetical protein
MVMDSPMAAGLIPQTLIQTWLPGPTILKEHGSFWLRLAIVMVLKSLWTRQLAATIGTKRLPER